MHIKSSSNNINIPPRQDEFELSVFGHGFGESIVIHLGDNKWVIVDSCVEVYEPEKQKLPSPLLYLKKINVNAQEAVQLIVATHWHDDHVKGLSKIVNHCEKAKFCCSIALNSIQFDSLLFALARRSMMQETGINELRDVLAILQKREKEKNNSFGIPTFAITDRCLYTSYIESLKCDCTVTSLSPSDLSFAMALIDFRNLLPQEEKPKKRLLSITPNRTSVVLWVESGNYKVLLGSDLEVEKDSKMGWRAIVESPLQLRKNADFFKIPHHGSENAHSEEVWNKMINKEHLSVLTPFIRGGTHLPTQNDIERISLFSEEAYITAVGRGQRKKSIKRDSAVQKTINETVKRINPLPSCTGHVRFRIRPDTKPTVHLFGDAVPLRSLCSL